MKNYSVKTVTELFLDSGISLDRSEEPLLGKGESFVSHPFVFPTVDLQLESTPELARIVDGIRMVKGYLPIHGMNADGQCDFKGWYSFHAGLNGFSETGLDNCIECIVCNTDSGDDEDMYCIDLSREEQEIIFDLLDVQCREAFGKGCRELLKEAAEAEGLEVKY